MTSQGVWIKGSQRCKIVRGKDKGRMLWVMKHRCIKEQQDSNDTVGRRRTEERGWFNSVDLQVWRGESIEQKEEMLFLLIGGRACDLIFMWMEYMALPELSFVETGILLKNLIFLDNSVSCHLLYEAQHLEIDLHYFIPCLPGSPFYTCIIYFKWFFIIKLFKQG